MIVGIIANIIFFCAFWQPLHAEDGLKKRVDLVSYTDCLLPDRAAGLNYSKLSDNFDLRSFASLYQYVNDFKSDDSNLQKIIFIDYCEDPALKKLPKRKLVCFKWEAIKIRPEFYDPYSVVYTFDDDLVDRKKFLKFCYPALKPMLKELPAFEEKKLCTMIVGNWNVERIKMLEFFEKKKNEFEFYGTLPKKHEKSPLYCGRIKGHYSSSEKISVLSHYRFCVCFENTHTTAGYITEKPFDAFAAGCVPIYWGPKNVEKYIPKNCFIDYRDFPNNETLYQFIKTMPKARYEEYLSNIRHFLSSEQAQMFSPKYFEDLVFEAASR